MPCFLCSYGCFSTRICYSLVWHMRSFGPYSQPPTGEDHLRRIGLDSTILVEAQRSKPLHPVSSLGRKGNDSPRSMSNPYGRTPGVPATFTYVFESSSNLTRRWVPGRISRTLRQLAAGPKEIDGDLLVLHDFSLHDEPEPRIINGCAVPKGSMLRCTMARD